jgi:glutathione S-transferase
MITLYTFGPALGLPDISPFVTKVEVLLKLAGLPYETNRKGFRKAPKGKLPYIDDDGVCVADSTFIRWHLEKKYGIDFDSKLSDVERAIAWSVEKMLEDHLYWAALHARWCDDANFANGPALFFRSIPWPLRAAIAGVVRRKVAANIRVHGIGRHSSEEMVALASKDIDVLATLLGNRPYLMGDAPCATDATAFAFVAGLLCPHFDTPLRKAAERHANLVAYSTRMMRAFYPELALPQLEKVA